MMYGAWDGGMGAGGWTLMIIFWVALLALVGLVIARLFPSSQSRPAEPAPPAMTPRQVLDERLAKGEIDVEAYERLREVLGGGGGG